MATIATTNGGGDFLSFYLSNPNPNVSITSLSRWSWKAEAKDTNGCGFLLFYYNKKRIIKKKEKKRVQWERNLPLLLIYSLNLQQWDFRPVGSSKFHFCCVFRFGCVDFSAFFFFLLHWFWWARRGCGCAVIFMGLVVVAVVCW